MSISRSQPMAHSWVERHPTYKHVITCNNNTPCISTIIFWGLHSSIWRRGCRFLRGLLSTWDTLIWHNGGYCDFDNKVLFGKLRYLPKKIASSLHDFRANTFPSLQVFLPPLPSYYSHFEVHAVLQLMDIAVLLRRLLVIKMCSNICSNSNEYIQV